MVGLCLAYFGFRKKLPLTLRSALYPIIGDKIYGPVGHAVDLLAVFGTVFGVATSLGLGVSQMATGLNHLFGIDPGVITQVVLIVIISIVATLSAVSGVGKGIRIISEWNIWLSIVLVAFFLFGGPTKWLLGFFVTSVGDLPLELHSHGLPDLQFRRCISLAGRVDDLLLGLVDLLGSLRRHVHRQNQPRAHDPRVHGRRDVRAHHHSVPVAVHLRRHRHLRRVARDRWRRHRRCRPTGPGLEPACRALWHHRPGDGHFLAELDHGRPGDLPAGDVVHYLLGFGNARHHHHAQHGQ